MGKTYTELSPAHKDWIAQQPMYFLASAPLAGEGHVNVSPRGLDSLRIIGDNNVALLDLTGSGNETAAHLHENRRITIMLCAFNGDPKILRIYGEGRVIRPTDQDWPDFRSLFAADIPGVRQIFQVSVTRIQSSCGFGVPLMDLVGQREMLTHWARKKGPDGIEAYQHKKNARSIDGLPAPGLGEP